MIVNADGLGCLFFIATTSGHGTEVQLFPAKDLDSARRQLVRDLEDTATPEFCAELLAKWDSSEGLGVFGFRTVSEGCTYSVWWDTGIRVTTCGQLDSEPLTDAVVIP